jgi:hypothetical protein
MMHIAYAFQGEDAPLMLAGPVDDLATKVSSIVEAKIEAWAAPKVQHYGDIIYDRVRERLDGDRQDIIDTWVADMKPKVQKAANEILDDASTQARLGEAKTELRRALFFTAVGTAVGTAVATWALVTYVGKP